MNRTLKLIVIAFLFLLAGCYPGINGKVVDATTGKPLEGVIVLAQWTKTGGLPGLTSSAPYAIRETETDKDGIFHISGVYYPFVDQPELVIYKEGYTPWRNDMDFKDMVKYDKNIWQNNITYKLNYLNKGYAIDWLRIFVTSGIIGSSAGKTPMFSKIESELFSKSQVEADKKRKSK